MTFLLSIRIIVPHEFDILQTVIRSLTDFNRFLSAITCAQIFPQDVTITFDLVQQFHTIQVFLKKLLNFSFDFLARLGVIWIWPTILISNELEIHFHASRLSQLS